MRAIFTLASLLFLFYSQAQPCGNSGPGACAASSDMMLPGLVPASAQIPPLVTAQPASLVLKFKNLDTNVVGTPVTFLRIDSISNLPAGLCWATNKPDNTFGRLEQGCLVIGGTPCALPGQYRILVHVTVSAFLTGQTTLQWLFEQQLYLRLKNPADSDVPVDESQPYDQPIQGYGYPPSCSGFPYFMPSLASADTVCESGGVSVALLTNMQLAQNAGLRLAYLDLNSNGYVLLSDTVQYAHSGTYTFGIPQHATPDAGTVSYDYALYLQSEDSSVSAYAGRVRVRREPDLTGLRGTMNLCVGNDANLGTWTGMMPSHHYQWYSESGVYLSGSNSLHITGSPDTARYRFVAYVDPAGCGIDTVITVSPLPLPDPHLGSSLRLICTGDSIGIGAEPVEGYIYWWSNDDESLSTFDPNPLVSPPSLHRYSLIVWDTVSGCSRDFVTFVDVKVPPYQDVCIVTVDSHSTHSIVVWEKDGNAAIDSFYIYREVSTNTYAQVGAVHADSLSEFHDYGANPGASSYRYRIATRDTCGGTGQQGEYHNTVHLQYLGGGNLQWNRYEREFSGTPVSTYEVHRDDLGNGNWQLIATLPGNQGSASDPDHGQYPNALYRVQAVPSQACEPSRAEYGTVFSNVIAAVPTGVHEESTLSLRAFPNPAKDFVRIYSPACAWAIADLCGRPLMEGRTQGNGYEEISLSSLPAGTYALIGTGKGQHSAVLLVKE